MSIGTQTDTQNKIVSIQVYNRLDTWFVFYLHMQGRQLRVYIYMVNVHCIELFE